MKEVSKLTTQAGRPVDNDQSSITTGAPESYTMLEDAHLVEKLAHFNRERIPERVVHAKGAGAFGYFKLTHDMSAYTCAALFNGHPGKVTDLFIRFSTVGGERGSADAARDPRGFAVKFYTEEGNYDMVGNNTPIFFIRDAIKFPDFIHTQKRNPATNLPDADAFWDFLSLTPESIHQVTILFSDRGTPKSYRHMDGHSSHTYLWYNRKNEYFWVKYHFKTTLGNATMTAQEAEAMAGSNPNHATEDLYNAIKRGDCPVWTLYVQIMTPEQAKNYKFDPFDVTKVWYHSDVPMREVGQMVLDRNPENFFADVEQAAFSPANFVHGIGPSPDRLLQGRLFAYGDAHRWRLGSNANQIPVNRPHCPVHTYQRDGSMAVDGNGGKGPNYWPNSFDGPAPDAAFTPPAMEVQAVIARHDRPAEDIDFVQAGELYRRVLKDEERKHLVHNITGHLGRAKLPLQYRQCALFYKADPDYGTQVALGLGLDVEHVIELAKMPQAARVANTRL